MLFVLFLLFMMLLLLLPGCRGGKLSKDIFKIFDCLEDGDQCHPSARANESRCLTGVMS